MGSLLSRLAQDRRGNSLIVMAFALFPLLAAIGCGVDLARAYMARAKLQQAVDAAALAGRRAMTADDISTATADASSYLAFNFPTGLYGTAALASSITHPDIGEVRAAASTTVPTSIMAIFGVPAIPIAAAGVATQSFKNVDIMLVLDTTGSMNDSINGVVKLEGLKSAVRALYEQLQPAQQALQAKGLRMRFGILPYAATVNVGHLLWNKSNSYIQTTASYYQWKYSAGGRSGSWSFGQQTYNLTNYVNGNALGNINGYGDSSSSTWEGCIEERKTVSTIVANDSRDAAPSDAWDLDIDRIPDGTAGSNWAPYLFDPHAGMKSNYSDGNGVNAYCPAQATELRVIPDETTLNTLLAKLVAKGSTYHDIGMIWGTRLISDGGVWGAGNPDTYNQIGVQRYIIFMTDGQMSAPIDWCCSTPYSHVPYYAGYGIEAYDKRVGGTSDDDNNGRHTTRFLMACNAAKAKGISIWTIAFSTGAVDSLTKCASSSDQASTAANSQELIDQFSTIGKTIGSLRIAQ